MLNELVASFGPAFPLALDQVALAIQGKTTLFDDEIRAAEVRCMGPEGENYGILATREAVAKARSMGMDLIEVSGKAIPPVAKIMDYGKFTYEQKKKAKARAKAAGRPYPNLVDNAAVKRTKKK